MDTIALFPFAVGTFASATSPIMTVDGHVVVALAWAAVALVAGVLVREVIARRARPRASVVQLVARPHHSDKRAA